VSIRAVANSVGVTAPSIYLHFSDKNELVSEVCRQEFAALHERIAGAVEGFEDPLDRIRAMGYAYVEFGESNPETYRVLFMHKPDAGPASEDLPAMLATSGFGLLVEEVQRAIAVGVFEGDVQLLAVHLWTAVHGVTSLLISHPDFPWPDLDLLKEQVLETLLRGLSIDR
jgi:AcrR family transcriptional regulator